jgi:hypothetical protein
MAACGLQYHSQVSTGDGGRQPSGVVDLTSSDGFISILRSCNCDVFAYGHRLICINHLPRDGCEGSNTPHLMPGDKPCAHGDSPRRLQSRCSACRECSGRQFRTAGQPRIAGILLTFRICRKDFALSSRNGRQPAGDRLLPRSSLRSISTFPALNSWPFISMTFGAATSRSTAAPPGVSTKSMSRARDNTVGCLPFTRVISGCFAIGIRHWSKYPASTARREHSVGMAADLSSDRKPGRHRVAGPDRAAGRRAPRAPMRGARHPRPPEV